MINPVRSIYRRVVSIPHILFPKKLNTMPYFQRMKLFYKLERVHWNIRCYHKRSHIVPFIKWLIENPEIGGSIIEAGCGQGGSTTKLSIIAKMLNKKLIVFDSFQGLPHGSDEVKNILGNPAEKFKTGNFATPLKQVKENISKYGELGQCKFVEGWFKDTLPSFNETICAAYIDVDLPSSTATCIKYLFPHLSEHGLFYSQDGDYPSVLATFLSTDIWHDIQYNVPKIRHLGSKLKIIWIERTIPSARQKHNLY
jgi:O-methyltransferase|tara:strand:- start:809 stop:1570 length:762 start_codon:yes stop_codon:yes gene_type:complete